MIIATERMEALEERLGLELVTNSTTSSFRIVTSAHDAAGRVIGAASDYGTTIERDWIYEMTVFDVKMTTNRPATDAIRVRIYPQGES